MKLDLQSELYAPTGNISGKGVERSLGTPTLDRLQLVIRETVQNAWDARSDDHTPVRYCIRVRKLNAGQTDYLKGLLSDLPATDSMAGPIERSLQKTDPCVIEIADYGTTGLGGPVRADQAPSADEHADFVSFFRNVGSPRDKHLGGGTYGYGKSATYALSECRTVIAYTQATNAGKPTARLMIASIGNPFDHRRKRYTGRHWWGLIARDGIVDPIEKERAHEAAAGIGLHRRDAGDRGTTIAILDPNLESRSLTQTANAIVESLVWFFWPKMIDGEKGSPAMQFTVELNEEAVEIPQLSKFPPLTLFAEAMKAAKGSAATAIRCERPIKLLGSLGLARGPVFRRSQLDTGNEVMLVPAFCHHVALMRPAELVVRYLEGPALPSDLVEYAGVFVCDEGVEADFAAAEPPAHDDWVPDNLEGHSRTFVRVALKRLHEAIARYAMPGEWDTPPSPQQSLAVLGDALSGVLIGQAGPRLGGGRASPSSGSGSRRSAGTVSISVPEPFRFAVVRKVPCALFRVRIGGKGVHQTVLRAQPFVVLEGGSSLEAAGLESPRVIAWLGGDGETLSQTGKVKLRVNGELAALIAVSVPGDCAIGVNVALEAED